MAKPHLHCQQNGTVALQQWQVFSRVLRRLLLYAVLSKEPVMFP
jgi:hypothetical protein